MRREVWLCVLLAALAPASAVSRDLPKSLQQFRDEAQQDIVSELGKPGPFPATLCPNMCSEHGICEGNPPRCACALGFAGNDCSIEKAECFAGDDCPQGHQCIHGMCHCMDGLWGADCTQECPEKCSENGACVEGVCFCDEGWGGDSCADKSTFLSSLPTHTRHGVVVDLWLPWNQPQERFIPTLWPTLQRNIAATSHKDLSAVTLAHVLPQSSHSSAGRVPGLLLSIAVDSIEEEQTAIIHALSAEITKIRSHDAALGTVSNLQVGESSGFASLSGLLVKGIKAQQDLIAAQLAQADTGCLFNCSFNGDCVEDVCVCNEGWYGSYCYTQNECEAGCIEPMVCGPSGNVCECRAGWEGDMCDVKLCDPRDCDGHGTCNNGTCECQSPWEGDSCNIENTCTGTPQCSGHGNCTLTTVDEEQKRVCVCDRNYHGNDCHAYLPCIRDCSGNGLCDRGTCVCDQGYTGDDCADEIQCPHECSGHGSCVLGICHCESGFTSYDCSRQLPSCPNGCNGVGTCVDSVCQCPREFTGTDCGIKVPSDAPCLHNCSGHGRCSHGVCECEAGFTGDDCSLIDLPCPNSCSGMGLCQADGSCNCAEGRTGVDCSKAEAAHEIDLCAHNCSGHGICTLGSCVCSEGYSGSDCSRLVQTCPQACSGAGQCVNGACVCESGFSGPGCATPLQSSYRCPRNCSGHGVCHGTVCKCYAAYSGHDCSVEMSCANNCSGQGLCVNGECACKLGYGGSSPCNDPSLHGRVDCSQVVPLCPNHCSGHGLCNDTGRCVCEEGFTGPDCSHGTECPYNCSGHGYCGPSGTCSCHHGFSGAACATPLTGCATPCPTNSRCNNSECVCLPGWKGADCTVEDLDTKVCPSSFKRLVCSGHGRCVRGACHCDAGWFGLDCTQFCPNNCSSSTCDTRGVCVDGTCHCMDGFSGVDCSGGVAGHSTNLLSTAMNPINSPLTPLQMLVQSSAEIKQSDEETTSAVPTPQPDASARIEAVAKAASTPTAHNTPSPPSPPPPRVPRVHHAASDLEAESCPNDCNSRGKCIKGKCVCAVSQGFGGPDCSQRLEVCPNSCSGAGWCNFTTGMCECARGFEGEDCSRGVLSTPPCDYNCTGSGICENGHCKCNRATSGKHCDTFCPNGCSGSGVCVHGACLCSSHYHGDDCSQYHPPVMVPEIPHPHDLPHPQHTISAPQDRFSRVLEQAMKGNAVPPQQLMELMELGEGSGAEGSVETTTPPTDVPDYVYEQMLREALHIEE